MVQTGSGIVLSRATGSDPRGSRKKIFFERGFHAFQLFETDSSASFVFAPTLRLVLTVEASAQWNIGRSRLSF